MHPLDHFFAGPRASRAFTLLADLDRPWGLDVRDEAALSVFAVLRGSARLDSDLLGAGDVAVLTGSEPYTVTDTDGSAPMVVIGPQSTGHTLTGDDLSVQWKRGVRRWGNATTGETQMLVGTYDRPDDVGGVLARALPRRMIVRPGAGALGALIGEVHDDNPAAQTVIDRLLDVLVIECVRTWAAESGTHSWVACADSVVSNALGLMYEHPFEHWTLARLASSVRLSRAAFAARFRKAVGETPMAHLTRWRLTLAGDLLLDPSVTVGEVAREVGYENPYAFSTAFKRQAGMTPTQFRTRRPVLA